MNERNRSCYYQHCRTIILSCQERIFYYEGGFLKKTQLTQVDFRVIEKAFSNIHMLQIFVLYGFQLAGITAQYRCSGETHQNRRMRGDYKLPFLLHHFLQEYQER